jgi:hypothetical protein
MSALEGYSKNDRLHYELYEDHEIEIYIDQHADLSLSYFETLNIDPNANTFGFRVLIYGPKPFFLFWFLPRSFDIIKVEEGSIEIAINRAKAAIDEKLS